MLVRLGFGALLLCFFAISSVLAASECPGNAWTGTRTLNEDAEFTLSYKIENDDLVIRLRAKTTGWIGFGLSESGHMIGADIVTAAVVNGVARIEDRFAAWDAHPLSQIAPAEDNCQHWTTLCAAEDETHTDVILSRPLNTSDSQDRQIVNGEMFVIFAWGLLDTVAYHGTKRGSTSINFFTELAAAFVVPDDVNNTIDVVMNSYTLNDQPTQYVLQLTDLTAEDRQVVAVEPIIKEEDKPFVHHLLLHDCGPSKGAFPDPLKSAPENTPYFTGGGFLAGFSPLGLAPCTGLVYGWAIGGSATVYPEGTGIRVGHNGGRFVVLELHLDNPGRLTGGRTITSGVRLHLAPTRQHDLGTIIFGDARASFPALPPGQARVHREATCPSQCTQKYTGPIHLVGSFPHMHSYGREIYTTKKDASTNEVTIVSAKQYWNFAFQNQYSFNITVNPGDELSTHCIYDTTKRAQEVVFGTGSNDEMCMDFVMYWPKANAGPKCGWMSGAKTECLNDTLSPAVANPIPDGTSAVPDSVAVGNIPVSCNLDLGVTRNPTTSPTSQEEESGTPSGSSPALAPAASTYALFISMIVAMMISYT